MFVAQCAFTSLYALSEYNVFQYDTYLKQEAEVTLLYCGQGIASVPLYSPIIMLINSWSQGPLDGQLQREYKNIYKFKK